MNDGKHVTDTYDEQTSSIASPIQTTTQAPGLDDTQQTNPIYSAKFFRILSQLGLDLTSAIVAHRRMC